MADGGGDEKPFLVEYASQGRAKCKTCKLQIEKTSTRIGKLVSNPFSEDGGMMKHWLPSLPKALLHPKRKLSQATLAFGKPKPSTPTKSTATDNKKAGSSGDGSHSSSPVKGGSDKNSKDNAFREFRRICARLAEEPSYNAKSKILADFFDKGSSGDGFAGDLTLWVKMLLPGVNKRVYNLQSKQLIKLFSQIFGCSQDDMMTDLEQGDVSETVSTFHENSPLLKPMKKSLLSLRDVDVFLDKLKTVTKEEDQQRELTKMTRSLDALDPNAYEAFQASNNLSDVVQRCLEKKGTKTSSALPGMSKKLSIRASLMTPVKPMLAEACKSFSHAVKKCPSGMYAEIKYDGERVQVHKSGNDFQFFSRSLKPVITHKVAPIKDHLPKACPHGNNLILDCEVLLVDNNTSKPLPFGTLGIHKTEKELSKLMSRAMKEGLEGLVMKDVNGVYEPGKRHWLKMKKDYLEEGAMADTADPGGTGGPIMAPETKFPVPFAGGLMSTFLMGVWDPATKQWCTVAKCGNGHDDKTIEKLNRELKMKKISKKAPVWEITGAEFSKSTTHTADGISIRFPRVTRIRDDKDWKTANDLPHLKVCSRTQELQPLSDIVMFTVDVADLDDNDDDDDEEGNDDGDDDDDDDVPSKDEEMKGETAEEPSEAKTETRKRKALDIEGEGSPNKKDGVACG
ncbi:DNA ligase 3 [Desmophyllum pertusum]|uniref:DNA ligase 3 n=1 Tax=Desmophyllum pertusum TaxID=174260 RepID=A0A9W9ZW03_9CNID|nr:DNA ligase 3 [Desmophyllum pertusum]